MTWADSADKHEIEHEDAVHAILNAVYTESEFDEPRVCLDMSDRPSLSGHRAVSAGYCLK